MSPHLALNTMLYQDLERLLQPGPPNRRYARFLLPDPTAVGVDTSSPEVSLGKQMSRLSSTPGQARKASR